MFPHSTNSEIQFQIKQEIDSDFEVAVIKEEPDILKSYDYYEKFSNKTLENGEVQESKELVQAELNAIAENDNEDDDLFEFEDEDFNNKSEVNASDFQSPLKFVIQHCSTCKESFKRSKDDVLKRCEKCKLNLLFECMVCQRRYKNMSNVFSHIKSKYDCRNKPDLQCSHCDYTSIYKGFIRNHLEKRHTGSLHSLKECSKCGRHFKRSSNVAEHELSCGKSPYLQCYYCDFSTTYNVSFKVHLSNHITDPKLGAALVDEDLNQITIDPAEKNQNQYKGIASSQSLQDEAVRHSQKLFPQKTYIDLLCRSLIKMYCYKCKETTSIRRRKFDNCKQCLTSLLHECGLCASKFNTCANVIRHLQGRHGHQNIANLYVCGKCDRWYDSFKKHARHENICGKFNQCDLCLFKAKTPSLIRRHKEKWHIGPSKANHHPCLRCGRQMRFFNVKLDKFECSACREMKITRFH